TWMGASASPTDRTGWAVIAPKVQPSRQRKTRRKTLWKRRTVEKSEERLFPRAWKSRQVRGIPTFPQRPRRLDDEESQKPKPDISLATKSGHFNLLRTTAVSGRIPGITTHRKPVRQSPGRSTRSRKLHSFRSISSWLTLYPPNSSSSKS